MPADVVLHVVPTDMLHPNPWNVNREPDHVREAVRESIREFGFLDPILVRPHPDMEDAYQIIDGEHRWLEAVDAGMDEVPVTPVVVDDTTAQRMSVVMNARGDNDQIALAQLLRSIEQEVGESMRRTLPFTEAEVKVLLGDGGQSSRDRLSRPADDTPVSQVPVTFLCSTEAGARQLVRLAKMLARETDAATDGDAVLDAVEDACRDL